MNNLAHQIASISTYPSFKEDKKFQMQLEIRLNGVEDLIKDKLNTDIIFAKHTRERKMRKQRNNKNIKKSK